MGAWESRGKSWKERCTVRGAQMSGSEVAKRYSKIKGENEYAVSLWVRILKYIPG